MDILQALIGVKLSHLIAGIAGLNSVTDGGNGGAGARGEIWVVEYENDPNIGTIGYGTIIG